MEEIIRIYSPPFRKKRGGEGGTNYVDVYFPFSSLLIEEKKDSP